MAVEHAETAQPTRNRTASLPHEWKSSLSNECRHVRPASSAGWQTPLQRLSNETHKGSLLFFNFTSDSLASMPTVNAPVSSLAAGSLPSADPSTSCLTSPLPFLLFQRCSFFLLQIPSPLLPAC